jgi:hypothetical protein
MGVAVAVLLLTNPDDEAVTPETQETEIASRLIYDLDPKKILAIIVTNEHGSYEVGRFDVDGTAYWSIEELSAVPLDSNFILSTLNNAASFTAARIITETPADLSVYGLDKPRADIVTAFDDGTVKNLLVGNESPTTGESYAMIYGSDTVYTVKDTAITSFLQDKYTAVNHVVYNALGGETQEQQLASTAINKMTIERKDLPYEIIIEFEPVDVTSKKVTSNSSSYRMVSPVGLNLNPDKSETLMTKVFGLTADSVIAVQPDEAMLAEYGLDDPYGVVIMDNVSGPFSMTFGNEVFDDEGNVTGRYCTVEGIDALFTFTTDSLPWSTVMPIDITAAIVTRNYIFDIDGLDFSGSGFDEKFTITGSSDDDFAVSQNGTPVDTEQFKLLYQFLLKTAAEELYIEDTTEEPVMTVRIYGEGIEDIIEFIPTADRRSIIRLNGQNCYKCKTSYVNRLIDNLGYFKTGEPLIMTW